MISYFYNPQIGIIKVLGGTIPEQYLEAHKDLNKELKYGWNSFGGDQAAPWDDSFSTPSQKPASVPFSIDKHLDLFNEQAQEFLLKELV
jgi:hypothetical protein